MNALKIKRIFTLDLLYLNNKNILNAVHHATNFFGELLKNLQFYIMFDFHIYA